MKVEICGVTHAEDAAYAAANGADYIGINFSNHSKRCVNAAQGKEIAQAARENGAEPVAICVDESLEEIIFLSSTAKISIVQLHGKKSQNCLTFLPQDLSVIFVVSVSADGSFHTPINFSRSVLLLYDSMKGGTGKPFDWTTFQSPNVPWILAGGLHPQNVSQAIRQLKPFGVSVSSGVEMPHSTRKDPYLVQKFIQCAKSSEENL